jgi:hypothetical protein
LFLWFGFNASEFTCANLEIKGDLVHDLSSREEVMSVRKVIAPSLALFTLALLAGCGGSSPTGVAPPGGGFSAKNLAGTYVFSSTGLDASSPPQVLEIAGTIVANGSGGITGGTIDIVGPDVSPATPVAQPITGGSYTVGADGRGQLKLGIATLDFVLTSSSHGLITEFDSNGSGSGTIDLQSTVTLAQLAGSYAFSLAGEDNSFSSTATAGSFTLDNLGNVTGGVQDFNDNTFPFPALPILPGTATLGTGTGPGSITLSTGTFGTLTFDYYPIDATHLKFIETDYIQFLAGDAFTQTGATIPTGQMVFTVAGFDNSSGAVGAGGIMTSDGTGNFSNGLEDANIGGNVSPAQLPFSGAAAPGGLVGGRVVVNMSTFTPATQYVIYPSSAGVLMLETDSLALTTGVAYAQTSQTFAASEGYGLNLSAFNTNGFEEDDIAEFTSSTTGFSGLVDINDEGSLSFDQTFSSSTYTPPDSTGRGFAATVEHGNNTFISYLFYVVNGSTVLLLETDSTQIGTGTIGLQNAASPGGVQPPMAIAHPPMRARGAFRHK